MTGRQPKASVEDRDAKVQGLIARMSDGVAQALRTPDAWKKALERQARFHRYSFGNQLLIAMQAPGASQVAGYRTWQAAGRQVRKGEKGIGILAPVTVRKTEKDEETGEERTRGMVVGFRPEYVFDIAQTDPIAGKEQETPEPFGVALDLAFGSLTRYAETRGLRVAVTSTGDPNCHGYYQPATRTIVVDPRFSAAMQTKTLAHEIAHRVLHPEGYDAGDSPKPREQAEMEAESTAFVVMSALGLETEALEWYSFRYVAGWHPEPKAVIAAGDRIAKAARLMIAAVAGDNGATADGAAA